MSACIPERIVLRMDEQPPGDNWYPAEKNSRGEPVCWTGRGRATVGVHVGRDREMLAVVAFEPVRSAQLADLEVEVDGARVPHAVRADVTPPCILARLPARDGPSRPTELALVLRGTVQAGAGDAGRGLCVISISLIPAQPLLKEKFPLTRPQRWSRRFGLTRRDNDEGDFPLSHFDGLAYLRAYPEVE